MFAPPNLVAEVEHMTYIVDSYTNRIYNKILDRDWFTARLFVT